MLRHNFALAVLSLCISLAFASEAPISAVVLYPGSATIERTAQVTPGMMQLEVKGLPSNFDTQTIRVQGDSGIQIGQVVTRDMGRTESVNARQAELEAKIQALKDKIELAEVEAKSAGLVQNYLQNLGSAGASSDKQQPLVDARSMAAMLDAIRRGGTDAFERMHHAEIQKRELSKQIDALERDLAKLRSGSRDGRDLTVQLAVRQAGSVRISYQVNNAGWKPTYRAFLDSSTSTVELERLATVSQKTGEDWSGVKLRLSSGQPRLSPAASEPQPWLVGYQKPAAAEADGRVKAKMAAAPAPMAFQNVTPYGATDLGDKYIPPVMETQGNFATEFDVPNRVNLPADGREISVSLSKQSMPAKQLVRTTPRMEKFAVVTAEAARPAGVWLSGTVQLYRDGSYVGTTHWNTQASDKFVFSFGRDDLIRVSVDRANERSGTTGIFSLNERKVADVYTITSLHKTPIDLLVLEASPVSTSEDVKVMANFQPKPTIESWEQRRGIVGWESAIAPNQALKFSVDYGIAYPKEGVVTGLP